MRPQQRQRLFATGALLLALAMMGAGALVSHPVLPFAPQYAHDDLEQVLGDDIDPATGAEQTGDDFLPPLDEDGFLPPLDEDGFMPPLDEQDLVAPIEDPDAAGERAWSQARPDAPAPDAAEAAPERLGELSLIVQSTYSGIQRVDGQLRYTVDPGKVEGKLACPT